MKRSPLWLVTGAIIGMVFLCLPQAHAEEKAEKERKVLYWYDPMVPGKKFDKPGKSPFMDMELVPKYAEEPDRDQNGGMPVVTLRAGMIQKMGVRTEKAQKAALSGGLRATGVIVENERLRHDVFTQVEGRVEELHYSAPGDRVEKGEVFYTLYSPELLSLQNDYLAAREAGYTDLAAAARRRMVLLGVAGKTLDAIAKRGKAMENVPFSIPADGILTRLDIRKGDYLQANTEIGQIQDLSVIWVEAAIPEKDMGRIRQGSKAKVTVAGSELEATVDYLYPAITAETRTGKARLVVENPDYLLKPSGYATVIFSTHAEEMLVVPSPAILHDSRGEHVILALGEGKFQPRTVRTGMASGGQTEILEGLSGGEEVVINGQFLIDSESNLSESLQKLSGEQ